MSNTIRRRNTHTAHERGWGHQAPTSRQRRRPTARPMQPKPEASDLVTSHAVLRWLERVEGDQAIRQRIENLILADGRAELIETVHDGRIRVAGTRTTLVIRGGCVVDVILENGRG